MLAGWLCRKWETDGYNQADLCVFRMFASFVNEQFRENDFLYLMCLTFTVSAVCICFGFITDSDATLNLRIKCVENSV